LKWDAALRKAIHIELRINKNKKTQKKISISININNNIIKGMKIWQQMNKLTNI
jgi:hypothetical protein